VAAQDVSLFPRYSTAENRATNYTMLLLRLLYEQSPALYEVTLSTLVPDLGAQAIPSFRQQESVGSSVIDGVISQRSYRVFVETKRFDQFDETQMRSHLRGLLTERADVRVLLALSSFPNGDQEKHTERFQGWADAISAAAGEPLGIVRVAAVSFTEVLEALPELGAETALARTINEYECYLQSEALLGSWRTLLDIVPIGRWPEQMPKHRMYSCPVAGTAYQHKRSAYLGGYVQGRVEYIAPILGMVRVTPEGVGTVVWRNDEAFTIGMSDEEMAATAVQRERDGWGTLFDYERHTFVLGQVSPTALLKPTPGGLRARVYVDLSPLGQVPPHIDEVAERLKGRPWNQIV
jgi:hypothetical protein